jgi:dienelactone hydrolase
MPNHGLRWNMWMRAATVLCLIAWGCGSTDAAMTQPLEVGTRIEFESQARAKKERIWGFLSIPSTSQAPYPLMLIMHSSGGLHPREWFFARTLNNMGIATFVLDDFGPRGLTRVSENKRSFDEREQAIDALNALAIVRQDPRIDSNRLAAMGRSLGGQTAVRLTLKAARDQLPIVGPLLNLAIAITPGCTSQQQDGRTTRQSEIWLFLADHDISPHQRCMAYVQRMVAAGGNAHFKVYPDTFHVFDGSAKPVWTPRQEVYANCANDRIRPGYSIRVDTGQALRTRKEWDQFFAGCVTRGGWVGGNPETTRQLDQDWLAVVKHWLEGENRCCQ